MNQKLVMSVMLILYSFGYRMPGATYLETAKQVLKWFNIENRPDHLEDKIFHDLCPRTLQERLNAHEIAKRVVLLKADA